MLKSSKNAKQKKRSKGEGGTALMQQMGFQIPNYDDPNFGADDNDDEDDDTLAAELQLIEKGAGGPASRRSKANQKKSAAPTQDLQSFHHDVNKLLTDIDRPINDDELSDVDENELLAELHEITGEIEDEQEDEQVETKPVQSASSGNVVALLETRLAMYKKAVEAAKASGESSKVRRMDRQFKFIQELLQTARAGKPIDVNEIPPEIGVVAASSSQPPNVPQPVPVQTTSPSPPPPLQPPKTSLPINDKPVFSAPSVPVPTSNNSDEAAIAHLKALALQAKAAGDITKAKEYLIQIKNLQSGATPISAPIPTPSLPASAQTEMPNNLSEDENSAAVSMPLIAPEPRTVMEALQQRHEELTKRHQEAVSKGESSKARRMDRLKNQYQEAIIATKKGQPYDYSELADLPGFAPIPLPQSKSQPPPPSSSSSATNGAAAPVKTSQSTAQMRSSQPQQQKPMPSTGSVSQLTTKPSNNTQKDQQIQSIRLKQEQLKKLALQAKQKNDLDAAKKYLIEIKGLEQTIASIEAGLPIETHEVLESPGEDYDMVRDNELTEDLSQSSRETIYLRLQEDLLRQMQLCARNQQIYAQMEGINNMKQANEYKLLEQRCARDLERLKQCFQHGLKAPVFHYEKRQLNIVQFNNDLTDNDFEVTVLRGINLQVPSGYSPTALETYVIIEFPYPPETVQTARTRHAIGSTNAEYPDSLHKFQIKRNDNKFKRLMNRKEIKFSIFYKAGFLRADRQLGTASIKLAGLEQTATIHESTDIYENDHKKKPEGKLEVKIRIREALGQTKSSELLMQKWLVIDRFEEISANSKPTTSKSPSTAPSITAISRLIPTGEALGLLAINLAENINNNHNHNHETIDSSRSSNAESNNNSRRNTLQQGGHQSIQVLQYEAELIQEQIVQLEDHFTAEQIEQLREKQKALKNQSELILQNLSQGGKQAVEEHIRGLQLLLERFNREENEYRQRNDIKKADIWLNKKNLVMKEIETLTGQPLVESIQL